MNLAESQFFRMLRRAVAGVVFLLSVAQALAQSALVLSPEEQAWLKAHPVIRIGVDPGYAPYSFTDVGGRPVGVASELTALVGQKLGVKFEMVPGLTWPQILEGARQRQVDLITTAAHRPDRDAYLNFTRNYLATPTVVMTRNETARLRSLDQLNGRRVALVRRYSSSESAMELYPGMEVMGVASPLEGLLAVSDGRAEAYIGVLGINTHLASRNGISNLKVNAGFDMTNGQAYGVRKDWPELVPLLEKALASIPEAQVQDIFSRWISVSLADVRLPAAALDKEALAQIAALRELRVGVLKNRPPFDFVDAKGTHKGLAADVLETLVQNTGLKIRLVPGDSTDAQLASLVAGELDMVLSVNGAEPGAPSKLLSEPYLVSSLGVFVLKGDIFLGEMRDLFDHRVVAVGNGLAQPLMSAYPRIQLKTVPDLAEGVQAVLTDQADFLVAETTSALRAMEDAGITGLRYAGPLSQAPVRLSLAVSPSVLGLRELIDTGLASITQAQAADIRRQWVGAPLQGGVNLHQVIRWASALALLVGVGALAFYYWNLRLKREVTRQTRLYAALTRCNEAIARCASTDELFPQISRIAVELGGMQMAWIGMIDTTTSLIRPVGWFGEQAQAYLQDIEISVDIKHPMGQGLTGLAVRENQAVWCQNAHRDERVAVWRSIRAKLGIHWGAMAVLPLRRQRVVVGTLSLNAGPVNAFDEKAQQLLVDMASDISLALDHFASEYALREVTKQLQTVANHAPVLIAQCDLDFRYRFVNQSYADLFRLTPQELVGQTVQQILGDAAFAQARPHMDGALAGHPGQYELELPDRVLGDRTLQVNYAPERSPDGQVVGFIAAILDITQRKRAEADARKSDAAFKTLFETSRDAITLTSIEGHFVGGNPAAFKLFGCRDREEFVAMSVADLSPERQPDGRLSGEKAQEIVNLALEKGSYAFEWVHRRRDGTDFVAEILITRAEADGVPIVQASLRDITERIRSRESLERGASELAAINALAKQVSASLELTQVTQAVLDQSLRAVEPDLAMLFLCEGDELRLLGSSAQVGVIQASSAAVQRLGECLGGVAVAQARPLYSLDISTDERCLWDECSQAGVHAFAALPLRRGDTMIGVLGLAATKPRDFESQATFLETLAEQASAGLQNAQLHGQIERHVAELEQRVLERTTELAAAKARAEGADQMKSAFLATMSHELRTPLNSIIGFTGVLMQKLPGPLNAEQEKQLGMVRNSGRHLLALINDVLDISKIEAGEMNLAHLDFDLHAVLEKLGAMFAPQVERRGLVFKLDVGVTPIMLTGDARRVEQVLNNLLSNALKFTTQGSIELACVRTAHEWVISVTDSGRGIKAEDMGKLFRPFGQIDNGHPGLHDGTGLGLAVSKQLVEAMGGHIEASSVPGQGSCFRFTLQTKEQA